MQFNTYTVAGARIAVWLVNHPAPAAAALTGVLAAHDVHEPTATPDGAVALRPWAARLREVFEAGTVAGKAELADALLVAADCRPRLGSPAPPCCPPGGTGQPSPRPSHPRPSRRLPGRLPRRLPGSARSAPPRPRGRGPQSRRQGGGWWRGSHTRKERT